jgi:hypothetical protein
LNDIIRYKGLVGTMMDMTPRRSWIKERMGVDGLSEDNVIGQLS